LALGFEFKRQIKGSSLSSQMSIERIAAQALIRPPRSSLQVAGCLLPKRAMGSPQTPAKNFLTPPLTAQQISRLNLRRPRPDSRF
jgi:hypothetical protein